MKRFSLLTLPACGLALSVMMSLPVVGQEEATAESTVLASESLAKSLQTWQELRLKCGGNYSYTVAFASWVGFGHSTEIVVRNNKVVERKYSEFNRNAPPPPPEPETTPGEKWTEKGEHLGSHNEGAPPKTLDDLYKEAQKVLETKLSPTQRLYVSFDKQGLLESCFYVDTRIADDAPRKGVAIGNIKLEFPQK
jgi:hypothetical protein